MVDVVEGDALRRRALRVHDYLTCAGLYAAQRADNNDENRPLPCWRIGAQPFAMSLQEHTEFNGLGVLLYSFIHACNTLYYRSISGLQPAWIAEYLDIGKPAELVAFSRMRRIRSCVPSIIRPDIIQTNTGYIITEIDSVPGGFGLTGALVDAYRDVDVSLSSNKPERNGIVDGFATMIRHIVNSTHTTNNPLVAIVVSEEAKDYRPEMHWLAMQLRASGLMACVSTPEALQFAEDGLRVSIGGTTHDITVLYRFFELFDLKNIPKTELIMYSNKKTRVAVTPPFKPFIEEKMWFALFHHPSLESYWIQELGEQPVSRLQSLIPRTWILDPRPIPPYATIANLTIAGRPVQSWDALKHATQKERRYVIKPSGFSPIAWGSRGVSVGHDLPQEEWGVAIDHALQSFSRTPFVLQEFHSGRRVTMPYYDRDHDSIQHMVGRSRLCPYYFIHANDAVRLGGTLVTVCPLDKKVIHGMKDAVIVPVL